MTVVGSLSFLLTSDVLDGVPEKLETQVQRHMFSILPLLSPSSVFRCFFFRVALPERRGGSAEVFEAS